MKEIIKKKKLSKIALLGIDPQVFHILHKHSTTNLCPWVPWFRFSFILFIFNNVCAYVFMCGCAHMCASAHGGQRCQIPWSYRPRWAAGFGCSLSSGRVICALNCCHLCSPDSCFKVITAMRRTTVRAPRMEAGRPVSSPFRQSSVR